MSWEHPWAEQVLPLGPESPGVVALPPAPHDAAAVRDMFSQHPVGIAAVCAERDGEPVGMVVTSFAMGISFDPALVLFSAQKGSRTWPLMSGAERIGISVLTDDHRGAVRSLASRTGDRFADVNLHRSESGAVFIEGARLWLECRVHSESDLGDHRLVVLEVMGASSRRDAPPLVYLDGRVQTTGPN